MCDIDMPVLHSLLRNCFRGHIKVCELLVDAGAIVNARNSNKETPLFFCARGGHEETCKLLINSGAKVDANDHKKWMALHYAARNGHGETCVYLANNQTSRADVEARARKDFASLHIGRSFSHS